VNDDVDRAPDRGIAQDPVLGDIPMIGNVGEILVTDDNQEIKVRLIAFLGRVDPVAAR